MSVQTKRRRKWPQINPELKPVVLAIFTLFSELENYSLVSKRIVGDYGIMLNRRQIRTIIRDPIYIGRPKKASIEDASLAIVPIELWEKCQQIADGLETQHKPSKEHPVDELIEHPFLVKEGLEKKQVGLFHLASCSGRMRYDGRNYMECTKCPFKICFDRNYVNRLKTQLVLGTGETPVTDNSRKETIEPQMKTDSTIKRKKRTNTAHTSVGAGDADEVNEHTSKARVVYKEGKKYRRKCGGSQLSDFAVSVVHSAAKAIEPIVWSYIFTWLLSPVNGKRRGRAFQHPPGAPCVECGSVTSQRNSKNGCEEWMRSKIRDGWLCYKCYMCPYMRSRKAQEFPLAPVSMFPMVVHHPTDIASASDGKLLLTCLPAQT